ncbi:MAG: acetate--CoA ligase family protein [Treponema sp.]|nr:acetate--CoA ligase family protein [Treponema sp.]MDR2535345.1 acetate--CoA ligase family protein [Treponema sp.]
MADLLEKISALLLALPDIGEIDLNPVIYDPGRDAFVAADARIKRN